MSVVSGIMGADAAEDAADTQAEAADKAIRIQKEMFDISREDLTPWREAGKAALSALVGGEKDLGIIDYEIMPGYAPSATAPRDYSKPIYGRNMVSTTGLLEKGPGEYHASDRYKIKLREGVSALDQSAAAKGKLLSGDQLKAVTTFGQELAEQDYEEFLDDWYKSLNPWFSLAGMGQMVSTQGGNQAIQTGQNMGQNALTAGFARAAGNINQANAFKGASNTALSAYSLYRGLNSGPSTAIDWDALAASGTSV